MSIIYFISEKKKFDLTIVAQITQITQITTHHYKENKF